MSRFPLAPKVTPPAVDAAFWRRMAFAGARYLVTGWVDTRFKEQLQEHQAELDEDLGGRAAQRQYEFDARKRLYGAIGPLRFQLAVACAVLSARVERIEINAADGEFAGFELRPTE